MCSASGRVASRKIVSTRLQNEQTSRDNIVAALKNLSWNNKISAGNSTSHHRAAYTSNLNAQD